MRMFITEMTGVGIALAVLCLVVGLAPSKVVEEVRSSSTPSLENIPGVKEISEYRQWVRVNLTSLPLNPLNAGLCRAPMPADIISSQANPHREVGKFFAVYVNEIGRRAMMSQLHPSFPQNSIIVKEKLPTEKSTAPELLTVMIKREKGFNPNFGDWEFLVLDGKATKIQARGDLTHCQFCHRDLSQTDYVFRTYLPAGAKEKLQ